MQAIENILRNHNLAYSTILNSDSGFTNKVYITDQYVVKVIKDRKRYDKECWFYENVSNNFTAPMIVNNSDEEPYIIFERINGISLYKIWHTMDDQERELIISRIAEIVRSIHHIDATAYNQVFHEDTNWIKSLYSSITETALAARDILSSEICENINQFLSDHINCMKDVHFAVNYTDLHFDNIFIDRANKLYLIDFETIEYAPIDYILDIWIRMSKYPYLYANEADEKKVRPEDYQNIVELLAKYYPELFKIKGHSNRMKLYALEYDLSLLKEYPNNMDLQKRIIDNIS